MASAKSKRYYELDEIARKRYDQQILSIDGLDPYTIKKTDLSVDFATFPNITYPDIVTYLLFAPSPYTRNELKNYKSLESYNHFLCGWVRDVGVFFKEDNAVVLGRVCITIPSC